MDCRSTNFFISCSKQLRKIQSFHQKTATNLLTTLLSIKAIKIMSRPNFISFLFLLYVISQISFASHLHTVQGNSDPNGLICGHVLSPDSRTAVQFKIQHSWPLVFLEELMEDGVRLVSSTESPPAKVVLILAGKALKHSDFIPISQL